MQCVLMQLMRVLTAFTCSVNEHLELGGTVTMYDIMKTDKIINKFIIMSKVMKLKLCLNL